MRRTLGLLLVLSLGHVLLISAQVQSKSGLPVLQSVAFGSFARVQLATASVADTFRSLWSHYLGLRGVARENDDLRRRVLLLEGQVQEQRARLLENDALREALALQRTTPLRTLAARVFAGDPMPGALTVTIDRGSADGVDTDMAVFNGQGIVGRVINRPAPHAAQVQLIVGPDAGLGVTIERVKVGGVAEGGAGDPALNVLYVPNSAEVRAGDRVLTSGDDRIYPPGFLVGTVERVERGCETFRRLAVRPAVDFSHIEFVLVVVSKTTPPETDPPRDPFRP
jgi:rod shape-determining protein MreC